MVTELPPLFQLTPKNPVAIKEQEYEAFLYMYGAHFGPSLEYSMQEQFNDDRIIIRSTRYNQSPISTFYHQGCIMIRFQPREILQKKGNQIQFIFKVKRMYPEDTQPIQIFIWNTLVKEEVITSKNGIDNIAFLTDVPLDGPLVIFLRPYSKEEIYTMAFNGLIAYLHD